MAGEEYNLMAGLKTIYARDCTPIADVRATVARSSLLNDIGEAVFNISTTDAKCRRDVLEFGNYIYIQNDSLADWVGIIDTPRTWYNGYVEVHAFEVPYILQYRLAPLNISLEGTPGSRVRQLLAYANSRVDTLIRPGNIFEGTVSSVVVVTENIYSEIKKIQGDTSCDWICTPTVDSAGKLNIYMDWLERAGLVTDLELSQGHNILYGDTPLDESGELINSVEGVSDPLETGTLTATYTDAGAKERYGLREYRNTFSGTTETNALQANAKAMVNRKKSADIATPLTVVNVGSTFANIRLGNIVKYKYTNVGFDDSGLGNSQFVRIEGFRFDEALGTCELFTGKVA